VVVGHVLAAPGDKVSASVVSPAPHCPRYAWFNLNFYFYYFSNRLKIFGCCGLQNLISVSSYFCLCRIIGGRSINLSELDAGSLFAMSMRRPPLSLLVCCRTPSLLSSVLNPRSVGHCCTPLFRPLAEVQAQAGLADDGQVLADCGGGCSVGVFVLSDRERNTNLNATSFDHGWGEFPVNWLLGFISWFCHVSHSIKDASYLAYVWCLTIQSYCCKGRSVRGHRESHLPGCALASNRPADVRHSFLCWIWQGGANSLTVSF
jgi:hypothetical protein